MWNRSMSFLNDFKDRRTLYERSSAPMHTGETIYYHILCAAIAQTYFTASRRECINFYRNTTTASSLSQPETPDEHRRFPARVVNDASSFNFRYAAFFGEGALSVFGVTVSFWEFSRLISAHDLVFISVSRVGFRRVASPESRGCLTSFHEKLANAPVLSSCLQIRWIDSLVHVWLCDFTRSLVLTGRKLNGIWEWYIRI